MYVCVCARACVHVCVCVRVCVCGTVACCRTRGTRESSRLRRGEENLRGFPRAVVSSLRQNDTSVGSTGPNSARRVCRARCATCVCGVCVCVCVLWCVCVCVPSPQLFLQGAVSVAQYPAPKPTRGRGGERSRRHWTESAATPVLACLSEGVGSRHQPLPQTAHQTPRHRLRQGPCRKSGGVATHEGVAHWMALDACLEETRVHTRAPESEGGGDDESTSPLSVSIHSLLCQEVTQSIGKPASNHGNVKKAVLCARQWIGCTCMHTPAGPPSSPWSEQPCCLSASSSSQPE